MKIQIKPRAGGVFTALVLISALTAQADDQKDKDKDYRNNTPRQTAPGRADTTAGQPSDRQYSEAARATGLSSKGLSKVNKASGLIGMEVKNQQNEKIGKIDDLVIDLQSGRVAYAIVSSGGFLGLGDKLIAVPTGAFTSSAEENKVVLNMDKQRLQSAPIFDKSNWTDTPDTAWLAEVYTFHGQQPYWDRSGDRIQLRNDKVVDTLENQRERLNDQRELPRNTDRDRQLNYNNDRKPDYNTPNSTPDVDNTKRNERDRSGDTLTPADQGKNESDREISRLLRKSIVVEKGPSPYSINARNIKIITTEGVVTLRGVVNSQAEKDSLEARAKQASGVTRVDNQLEVKASTK